MIKEVVETNKQQKKSYEKEIDKKKILKENLNKKDFEFFSIFKSQASGIENVRFPDSPDFEELPDFQTRLGVR